ncbi:acetolactate synthase [Moniliophthora roreri]|nr:acetolactate synthase [Moniliophthora roreri]
MYFPLITSRYSKQKKRSLSPRAGGGGGGRGGGGSGGRSGGGSSGGSSGGGGRSGPVSVGGTSRPASSSSNGGGPVSAIPSGQFFSGRQQGGGTRDQIYGNSQYGSGYPGIAGRGVANRGFPFFFWPVAWGGAAGVGSAAYLHNREYGNPDNSSRPGGPMVSAAFVSNSTNSTFRVVADNFTVTELIQDITSSCSSNLNQNTSSTTPSPINNTDSTSPPQPENAIQYYRASSVALTLDGYNDTSALSPDENAPPTPLPSNIDTTLKDCLNQTIGASAPLIDPNGALGWNTPSIGITHAFVNWGSDHPALLEDLQRQRTSSGETCLQVITCPNEMVALSAAQGYGQVTGKPAAVIVHVDVGTQALAGAIHNVDRGRTPVLIYAGASPFSSRNEQKGSRNEWIMWIQDIPDQPAIVRQYMRQTTEIHSGKNIDQVVNGALQIARSDPKGPVYLWARREVMEEELSEELFTSLTTKKARNPIPLSPSALSPNDTKTLVSALLEAENPLIITSHLGRNKAAVAPLVELSWKLAIPILCTCPSAVNVPFEHPYSVGVSYHTPDARNEISSHFSQADVIIVIDSDIPWKPSNTPPNENAKVFILDSGDPLKVSVAIGSWEMSLHAGVEIVARADAETALKQIIDALPAHESESVKVRSRGDKLKEEHDKWMATLDSAEVQARAGTGSMTVPYLMTVLRSVTSTLRTLTLNEGISNYPLVWEHLRPQEAGSMLTSGGASLGWSLAASAGAHLALGTQKEGEAKNYDLIMAVVGDGSYLFGVPSSAFWPFLTVILNNGGWKSPKLSMLGVHPTGYGSRSTSADELSVGFGFDHEEKPDYAQIAVAATAGWAWGKHVEKREELEAVLKEAVRVVREEARCAVVDCVLEKI